jgi:signal transduction histidine kinase
VYAVRDWGIGIPQSQQSRIFSKFFRAENALQKAPDGSGLGLALAKELVEAWDGRVWFETAEGQGTTFYFSIPATISEDVVAENVPHDIIEGNHN